MKIYISMALLLVSCDTGNLSGTSGTINPVQKDVAMEHRLACDSKRVASKEFPNLDTGEFKVPDSVAGKSCVIRIFVKNPDQLKGVQWTAKNKDGQVMKGLAYRSKEFKPNANQLKNNQPLKLTFFQTFQKEAGANQQNKKGQESEPKDTNKDTPKPEAKSNQVFKTDSLGYLICKGNQYCKYGYGWLELGENGCKKGIKGYEFIKEKSDEGCSCSC